MYSREAKGSLDRKIVHVSSWSDFQMSPDFSNDFPAVFTKQNLKEKGRGLGSSSVSYDSGVLLKCFEESVSLLFTPLRNSKSCQKT